jgi:flagellar motor switch protein FliG
MELTEKNVKGRERAAILLATIGVEGAARVLAELSKEEIEVLAGEISDLSRVKPELVDQILEKAYERNIAYDSYARGGLDYARDVLTKALSPDKAEAVLTKVRSESEQRPFKFVGRLDSVQLVNFLQSEHPQTIALILAHLDPRQVAQILLQLPEQLRGDVAQRIATFGGASPEVIRTIEQAIAERLEASAFEVTKALGGIERVAEILNHVGKANESQILDDITQLDPELAQEIKDRMFTFDDLVRLDDRSVQTLLREVDSKVLALSLKACSDEVRDLIFKNMSKRATEALSEEMDYMGPVRVADVEEAHRKILEVVRRLETEGAIFISGRGSGNEIIG